MSRQSSPEDQANVGTDNSITIDHVQTGPIDATIKHTDPQAATRRKRQLYLDGEFAGHHKRLMAANYLADQISEKQLKSEQTPSSVASSHLVKTVADLPIFITIDGFRVASYVVDGEPQICLPHLLQFVQKKYPHKIIETFEKVVSHFLSASPKQVEGFVKAMVLPASADSCPLIRRSDAERACMTLYDMHVHEGKESDDEEGEDGEDDSENDLTKPDPNNIPTCSTGRAPRRKSDSHKTPIFETKHQEILNLARASTSTLRIKLFHRCFGKCCGIYYPRKLEHENSKCIECEECHRLFAPRRFIGHSHKTKEDNVCHWGFNSYMWRHYLHLCKNQDINQLDEDELLMQLRVLKSVPGKNIDGVLGPDSEEEREAKVVQERQDDKPASSNNLAQRVCSTHPVNIVKPTVYDQATTSGLIDSYQPGSFPIWPPAQPPQPVPLVMGADYYRLAIEQNAQVPTSPQHPWSSPLSSPLFCASQYKPNMTTPTLDDFLSQLGYLGPAGRDFTQNIQTQVSAPSLRPSAGFRIDSLDQLIKQDMFVSSSMAAYLSSRCLDGDLVRDIIRHTLEAIEKARKLF